MPSKKALKGLQSLTAQKYRDFFYLESLVSLRSSGESVVSKGVANLHHTTGETQFAGLET